MRLVTSIMTVKELEDVEINRIIQIFTSEFPVKYKTYKFKYDDRKYHEFDIDLFDVVFTRESIYDELERLIHVCESCMENVSTKMEFIAANDDTDSEIQAYETNIDNINNFGLFVTSRIIPGIKPFFSSKVCNAYVNLQHVSFGVYD